MPRPALSEQSIEEQRERTLAAAFKLFTERGLEAVTLRAIAAEVALSAMALYRYFPGGKGEVLATLRGRGFEDLAARFDASLAGRSDPVDRILALVVTLLRFALEDPALYRLLFDVTQEEEYGPYLASRRARAWGVAAGAFVDAIEAGLLRGDPELLPHLVFAALHGAISFEFSMQPHPNRRLCRTAAPMLELVLRGAGARPPLLRKLHKALAEPGLWSKLERNSS